MGFGTGIKGFCIPNGSSIAHSSPITRAHRRSSRLFAHIFAREYLAILPGSSASGVSYSGLFSAALELFITLSLEFQKFIISNLSKSIPSKTDCSYSLLGSTPSLVKRATAWKPIGSVGNVSIPDNFFTNSININKKVKVRKGYQVLSTIDCTSGPNKTMLTDLYLAGLIGKSQAPSITMNLSVRPKPNNPTKSLLISDCRTLINNSIYAPKTFTLPKLSCLFHLPISRVHYFTKLDLSNAYHSVSLPSWLEDQFRFSATLSPGLAPTVFKWLKLPFGWDRSPKVFQEFMELSLKSISSSTVLILSYLDDILLVSVDPLALASMTNKAVSMLKEKGFIISPNPKSLTTPETSIDWLGKHLHSDITGIYISTPQAVLAVLASLIIFSMAKKGPSRIIRTICGIISWCNYHNRLAFPFLHHAQNIAHYNTSKLTRLAFRDLITALHISSIPTMSTPIKWGLDIPLGITFHPCFSFKHPMESLSVDHHIVFCDASIADHRLGMLIVPPSFPATNSFSTLMAFSLPIPFDISSQQGAELYAVKVAIVKFTSSFRSLCFATDSESSLYSINKLSSKIRHHVRSKILRQISRKLLSLTNPNYSMAFIPGQMNPADVYSRLNIGNSSWHGHPFTDTLDLLPMAISNLSFSPPFNMSPVPQALPTTPQSS